MKTKRDCVLRMVAYNISNKKHNKKEGPGILIKYEFNLEAAIRACNTLRRRHGTTLAADDGSNPGR